SAGAALIVLALMTLWPPLILPYGFWGDLIADFFRPDEPIRYCVIALAGCLGVAVGTRARPPPGRQLPLLPPPLLSCAPAPTPPPAPRVASLRFSRRAARPPRA